ncbi:hypothetical protein ACFX1T_005728 [Malus domestica]
MKLPRYCSTWRCRPRQTGAEKWREFRCRFRRRNRNLKNQRMVLRDHEQVEAIILIHCALSDDKRKVVNSVEAELTNMDLKSISARSLPDPHTLRKSSHLLGSKVLQKLVPGTKVLTAT